VKAARRLDAGWRGSAAVFERHAAAYLPAATSGAGENPMESSPIGIAVIDNFSC